MHNLVRSVFSISSRQFDAVFLTEHFPWRVIEASSPVGKVDYYVTSFDLGIGEHDRVDYHLIAAKTEMLKHESELESLCGDCNYALWIKYRFPAKEGAININ
jgi:hypothetical protein